MSNVGQFAILYNATNWEHYKGVTAAEVLKQQGQQQATIDFPNEPKRYPCLVASLPSQANPLLENTISQQSISCCYVYPQDAERLIAAVEHISDSILVELPEEPELQSDDEEMEYAPTQTGVLLLALVVELEAIGALNQDKLLKQIEDVEEWLISNQQNNLEDQSLSQILIKLWQDRNA